MEKVGIFWITGQDNRDSEGTFLYGILNVYSKGEDRSRLFSPEELTLRHQT